MLVVAEFLDDFESIPYGMKITVDADYNETVENIKVLISLKHVDLDIGKMILFYNGRSLKDSERLSELGIKDGALLQVRRKGGLCSCF